MMVLRGFNLSKAILTGAEENAPTAWVAMDVCTHWPFEDPVKFEDTEEENLASFEKCVIGSRRKSKNGWPNRIFLTNKLVIAIPAKCHAGEETRPRYN
jgi:hypothetical protein